ncbi:MAG: sialate O-acetylesterase [Bacilli bacterium]|jgi:hypothetical protein
MIRRTIENNIGSISLIAILSLSIAYDIFALVHLSNQRIPTAIQHFTTLDSLPDGGGQSLKVILLAGQSNASGVGSVAYLEQKSDSEDYARYELGYDNILINFFSENGNYSSEGAFVQARVGQGCTPDYIGPELGLADHLSPAFEDEHIIILKYSWGGSTLHTDWRAPSSSGSTGKLFTAFINFTSTHMNYLLSKNYDANIEAMCWMQGESDGIGPASSEYEDNLRKFISDVRTDLSDYSPDGGMYFIDAGIYDSPLVQDYQIINQAKMNIASSSPLNRYIDTIANGLEYDKEPVEKPDLAHFDALSCLKLGYLFADEIIELY